MSKIKVNLKDIVSNPIEYGSKINIPVLAALIRKADNYYYNTNKVLFDDDTYDILKDKLKERAPENPVLKTVGIDVIHNKVVLPYYMGSMNKYAIDGIKNWICKYNGPYIISDKLDGISALYVVDVNNKLYTRGNGKVGSDISNLINYVNISVPKLNQKIVVRGELIMSKQNFEKYSKINSNARSLVSGQVNAKKPDIELLKNIDFIAYELLYPNMEPIKQFELLKKLNFKTPNISKTNLKEISKLGSNLEGSHLLESLITHRVNSDYDIDGIIVTDNSSYETNISGNPKYSFAFKMNGSGKETEILDIQWNPSKHGYLKPRLLLKPIELGGSIIKHTTGFHAKYIINNSLGPGSIIRLVKSGEVIPHIIDIIKSTSPKLPDVDYKWDATKVNFIMKNPNKDYHIKKITSFFSVLNVENISSGIVTKLYEHNYDSIYKILSLTIEDLIKLPGFREKSATKIYNNIHKIIDNPIDISKLMSASLKFGRGFGIKRFEFILSRYPNILDINIVSDMIIDIPGFQETTAKQFIQGLTQFKLFLCELPMIKIKPFQNILSISDNKMFNNKQIVMTGFRDSVIQEFISLNGGKIQDNVNKNTSFVITKDENSFSSKIDKANLLGINIISLDNFKKTYNYIK